MSYEQTNQAGGTVPAMTDSTAGGRQSRPGARPSCKRCSMPGTRRTPTMEIAQDPLQACASRGRMCFGWLSKADARTLERYPTCSWKPSMSIPS
jgi:hypothetical protein